MEALRAELATTGKASVRRIANATVSADGGSVSIADLVVGWRQLLKTLGRKILVEISL